MTNLTLFIMYSAFTVKVYTVAIVHRECLLEHIKNELPNQTTACQRDILDSQIQKI